MPVSMRVAMPFAMSLASMVAFEMRESPRRVPARMHLLPMPRPMPSAMPVGVMRGIARGGPLMVHGGVALVMGTAAALLRLGFAGRHCAGGERRSQRESEPESVHGRTS